MNVKEKLAKIRCVMSMKLDSKVSVSQSVLPIATRIWSHIGKRRRMQMLLMLALMIIASLAEAVSIGAVLPFLAVLTSENPNNFFGASYISNWLGSDNSQQLLILTIAFSGIAIICGTLRLILMWVQTRISYAVGGDFSVEIYEKTLQQPYSVHISRNSSELISAMTTKVNGLVFNAMYPFLVIISSVFMITIILIALLMVDPIVALVTFALFGTIYLTISYITKDVLQKNSKLVSENINKAIKSLQEGLGGIRDVILDNSQDKYIEEYKRYEIPMRKAAADVYTIAGSPRTILESLGIVCIACLAYFMTKNGGSSGGNAIPVLGTIALGAQKLLPMMQQVYSSWAAIKGNQASTLDALDLMEQTVSKRGNNNNPKIEFNNVIDLNGIEFGYSNKKNVVIKNLNFQITKGMRLGIVGVTGSGKSTLVDILMGLLPPSNGYVAIDGKKLTNDNRVDWQNKISHVPQSIFLTDSTIAENIAFGVPKECIDINRVLSCAKIADLEKFIQSLPMNYAETVGERGVQLSGGQRQRIGIARALYKNSELLVFDEATSALDPDTEDRIIRSIDALPKQLTIVSIAHRYSTLKYCDRIIRLTKSGLESFASYEEFIKNSHEAK